MVSLTIVLTIYILLQILHEIILTNVGIQLRIGILALELPSYTTV